MVVATHFSAFPHVVECRHWFLQTPALRGLEIKKDFTQKVAVRCWRCSEGKTDHRLLYFPLAFCSPESTLWQYFVKQLRLACLSHSNDTKAGVMEDVFGPGLREGSPPYSWCCSLHCRLCSLSSKERRLQNKERHLHWTVVNIPDVHSGQWPPHTLIKNLHRQIKALAFSWRLCYTKAHYFLL